MYHGIFQNTEAQMINEYQSYWLIKNEAGDNYYDLRDNLRPKYIVITEVEAPYLVCGADEDGFFSFSSPLKVYCLDDVPSDITDVRYCFDGKEFRRYIDVDVWRYNELLWLKSEVDEIEDSGGDVSHLRQYRILVRNYVGDGVDLPTPTRPQESI